MNLKQIITILMFVFLSASNAYAQHQAQTSDSDNQRPVSAFMAAAETTCMDPILISAGDFPTDGTGFYRHKGWLAINPEKRKTATTQTEFKSSAGKYDMIFVAVGEYDGESVYELSVNGRQVMNYKTPLSKYSYEEGVDYSFLIDDVVLKPGDQLKVTATVGTDGTEFSRARWAGIILVKAGKGEQLLKKLKDKGTTETLIKQK